MEPTESRPCVAMAVKWSWDRRGVCDNVGCVERVVVPKAAGEREECAGLLVAGVESVGDVLV